MAEPAITERPWGAPVNANDADRPRCGTCRFFRRKGQKCQRFPPVTFFDVNALQRVTAFPSVTVSMWCGEYAGVTGLLEIKRRKNR